MNDLNSRIAIGATWLIALRIADRIIGFVSIVILARLLLPTDFGLVAYAMTFYAILELFFLIGVDTYLISDKDADKNKYNTAWTLEIIKGIIIAIAIVASAESIATFFNEPEVETILYWIAIIPVFLGLENIGTVNFQKHLEFNREFIYLFTVRISTTIITISLAYLWGNYWALVYGMVARGVLRFLLSYILSSYRPWLSFSEVKSILNFSKWILLQNILSGLNERFPTLVIGRHFDPEILSYYNMGFELSNTASQELAAPIRRALFPGIAQISHDRMEMINVIRKTIGILVLVGFPITIGVTFTAPLIVPVVLGENWLEVIPVIQVLGILASTYILYSNSHVAYYTMHRPDITSKLSILKTSLIIPFSLYLIPSHGAVGAALAMGIANVLVMVIDYAIFVHFLKIKITEILNETWRSLVGVAIMAISVIYLIDYLQGIGLSNLTSLIICSILGASIYITIVLGLWLLSGSRSGPERFVLNQMSKLIKKLLLRNRLVKEGS